MANQENKETTAKRIARKAEELKQKIKDMRKRMEQESDSE